MVIIQFYKLEKKNVHQSKTYFFSCFGGFLKILVNEHWFERISFFVCLKKISVELIDNTDIKKWFILRNLAIPNFYFFSKKIIVFLSSFLSFNFLKKLSIIVTRDKIFNEINKSINK